MAERIKGLQIDLSMQDMGIGSTLAGIRRSFRQLNSDLKLSSNNFKYSEKSMASYKSRIRELDAATKQQRNNVKELRNQYMQTAKEQGANSAKAVRLRTEYNKQADTLNRLEHELDQTVDGFKRFQKEAQEAARVSNSSFGRLGQKFTDIGPKLTSVGESMKNVGRSMSMYVTAPIVAGFGLAAKKSIDFDDSMRKVKATSGATGGEFQQLRDKALEMGAKTKFSASESAEALNYMALAGWDTKDMLGGIDGVMQLAAASGEDLGAVSDIVTDSLTAFGMKAKDSGRFADVLAQTSSKANTDVRGLGEAFKYAAPVAGALGYTVEDTSIAIGLMSNAGIKGEKAGTALRTMFTNLAKPTKAMKDKMEELGISITDSNGKMLPMRDVIGQLRDKFKGLSKDQQASAAATIFGKEAMSGALAVINASDEDYKKLTKSIDNSTGASKRMSDEMEGGIGGSIRKMKSAIESLAISIGDVLAPHIRKAADFLAMLADKFTNMPGWVKTGVVGLGIFAAALGPLILTTGAFTAALGSIMTTIGPVMTDITKAGGLMNFLGTKAPFAAKGLTLVGGAFKFMLGPVGLAIAAIVAIGTAFVVAYKKSETFRNIVNAVIDPVVNAFKNLRNTAEVVFNALKNLFSGNALPTVDILSKIMPKATAIKVTATLMQIRQVFIDVFNAIWQFGQDIGLKLGQFWNQNGATIMQALTNIWNTIVTVFTEIKNFLWPILQELGGVVKTVFMNVIVPAVKIGMQIIWGVMKFLWPLIKTLVVDTWNNIKNIINGALDIILGIVKIFSGLFTGQWKQVWNGIKQVFSGALTLIWNLIQLWFIGKILKVVKIFGGFFKSIISKAFNGVKTVIGTVLKFIWSIISTIFKRILSITRSIFGAVLKFIRFIFNSIKNFISKTVKAIYNNVKKWFTSVWNVTKAIFGKLKNWVIKLWSSIKNKVVGIAKGLYNSVKNRWNALWSVTKSIFNRLKNWVVKLWSSLKNKVIGLAKSLWNGVKNRWNALWNGTRSIFNKVKNFMSRVWRNIKNTTVRLVKGLWNGVKRTWNNLFNGTRNIFNKVKNTMSNIWRSIKNSTVNMAKGLWNRVRRTFNNMAGGLKNIIGKIKGHITGMVKAVKEGLNKLIGGVNWVADKIGMKKIPTFKFHTGTESTHTQNLVTNGKLNQNTLATVGDKGKGNGPGGFRHETIIPPKGKPFITPAKDTTMPLSKGTRILNGAQTHAMLTRPQFSMGTIPKFAKGTKKKGFFSNAIDTVKDVAGNFGQGVKNTAHSAAKVGKEKIGDVAEVAKDAVSDAIAFGKDIFEYIDNPMELINKVIDKFGVNFDFLKGAELPYKLMQAMFKKLKNGVKDLVKGWLEEMGGGDGGYLFDYPIWQRFGRYTGGLSFNGGNHYGIDFGMPTGTPIYAVKGGVADRVWTDFGGGNSVQVKTGANEWNWYMHLSKQIAKQGQKIRSGQLIGKSGATGNFVRGAHLHFQLMRGSHPGNDTAIDPMNWLKKLKGGGGSPKAGRKWAPQIKQALRMNGLPTTSEYVNAWARQIDSESSGNPRAVQGGYVDANTGGNEAKGLVQVARNTFNSMKFPGHGNVFNPLDNLLAGIHWAKYKYGKNMLSVIGHGHGYATGGLIKNAGWYNIAEGGYPEWVIPTDPNRRTDAMKLLALAAKDIEGNKTSGNKRPSNFSSTKISSNQSDNSKLEQKLDMLIGLMNRLVQSNDTIANKDFEVSLDGKELSRNNSKQQALKAATQLIGG
ncbi:phage tail tape measure protein [Staphylococcus hominis]|uniref:phage tail tape measure protein n=1 Tax=Staphylococcus hominis TaxID=1290 RepID=UPI002878738E|nr:phage tail tape measure protein [Staphylococcus hominis]MDS3866851.1 phage tail tape measure protein [Staphylococcus hominis]